VFNIDQQTIYLLGGVVGALLIATIISLLLKWRLKNPSQAATIENLWDRVKAWWVMCGVFAGALLTGGIGSVALFFISSTLAFREFLHFISVTEKDKFVIWVCYIFVIPLQYYLIAIEWYGLFSILIPVYGFLLIPLLLVFTRDTDHFFTRAAKVEWALMLTVYCISHAPALLMLKIPGFVGNAKLLLFLILISQFSDVMQYVFGKLLGRRKIAPLISPNKTLEGFIGGVASSTLLGSLLWWATPFSPLGAAVISLTINLMGFAGGLVMSAVKRGEGTKDYGTLIKGHGGVMDRLDSVCFAAPVFFHIIRYYYT
jgi:phosphatidate cytidylyltransferase